MAVGWIGARRQIRRWLDAGLIDQTTAERLTRDVEANRLVPWRLADVLAMMAAILAGAAILIFVAANWDAIPRLWRVGMLFAIIAGSYLGGAWLRVSGHDWGAQALWVVGSFAFGGAIAMISQMYHLSGEEDGAILLWAGGVALAALAFRSGPLAIMTALLGTAWMLIVTSDHGSAWYELAAWPLMATALWALAWWSSSTRSRHVILFSVVLYLCVLDLQWRNGLFAIVLCSISAAIFVLAHFRAQWVGRIFVIGDRLGLHAVIGFLFGIWTLQWQWADTTAFLPIGAAALAAIVGVVIWGGHEDRATRRLAYAAFALQMVFIYAVMIGTMMGTAGFFLIAGAVLAALAYASARRQRQRAER